MISSVEYLVILHFQFAIVRADYEDWFGAGVLGFMGLSNVGRFGGCSECQCEGRRVVGAVIGLLSGERVKLLAVG